MRSFSIDEWCALHGFSRSFFYKLAAQGEGPKPFKCGRCTRISEAAAIEWIASREAIDTGVRRMVHSDLVRFGEGALHHQRHQGLVVDHQDPGHTIS